MKWTGELTVDSADFDPCDGAVELSLRALPGRMQAFITPGDIVACIVSFACPDGLVVERGKRYRVTVEEVECE